MRYVLLILLGGTVGCIGGMVGIGGGVLMVPALTELFALETRKAAGITLAAMIPPVTLPGAWQYYRQGHLTSADLTVALTLGIAFAVGGFLGGHFQARLSVLTLRLCLGLLLVYVAVRMLYYSNNETINALRGVSAVVLAWGLYLWLRALGRKHGPRPQLREHISQQPASADPLDYSI